jgi:hypothetical protein
VRGVADFADIAGEQGPRERGLARIRVRSAESAMGVLSVTRADVPGSMPGRERGVDRCFHETRSGAEVHEDRHDAMRGRQLTQIPRRCATRRHLGQRVKRRLSTRTSGGASRRSCPLDEDAMRRGLALP